MHYLSDEQVLNEPTCSCDPHALSHCRPSWGSRRRSDLSPRTRSSCRWDQTPSWKSHHPVHDYSFHPLLRPMASCVACPLMLPRVHVNHTRSCNRVANITWSFHKELSIIHSHSFTSIHPLLHQRHIDSFDYPGRQNMESATTYTYFCTLCVGSFTPAGIDTR